MKVVKFGGSSLATGEQFDKIIKIITDDPKRQVIVTSAPGKRFTHDTKVTDLLIQYAQTILAHQNPNAIIQTIWQRYAEIGQNFALTAADLQPLLTQLTALATTNYPSDAYLLAAFKAHGEKLNAQLLTFVLQKLGYTAQFWDPQTIGLTVTDQPNDAEILPETYAKLRQLTVQPHTFYIVPGFYGLTSHQHIATFSRGGSDITGAILAKGLNAQLYENFTDVNAVYAADPRIVAQPQPIKKMTYRELRELSYAGFSVFHDEALIPTIQGQIPINIKNTNQPQLPGTMIVPQQQLQPHQIVTGVASDNHFAALYLHRYLLNKQVGFTLQLLKIFYKYQISYEHMPSGIDDLTVIFDRRQFTPAIKQAMCQEIQATLQPDQLEWIDDYAILMVVGEGMANKVGVVQKIIDSLAQNQIGLHMINQGASRISIMLGTKQADAPKAVQAIYHTFFHEE
ncbi:aspartate kinase [Bombilactobacillus folatiphilus]|uniref:Aspartokinase n=1 Tax=Bombilactobacillus folatiphilus TaxID=2923362 RepID=A0ABY4P9Y5_9LACO|nr:aspartate kinase [Bombilactobacillus folatiphilus]UQS82519.1 aspartate kinase [Bombilactobacillus folatiphilus]